MIQIGGQNKAFEVREELLTVRENQRRKRKPGTVGRMEKTKSQVIGDIKHHEHK
jgi:hypothetical protein